MFEFAGTFKRNVKGSAVFRSPSITAIIAPGPTDGAAVHSSSPGVAVISAASSAQAADAMSDPLSNASGITTLLSGFIMLTFRSARATLGRQPAQRLLAQVKRRPWHCAGR